MLCGEPLLGFIFVRVGKVAERNIFFLKNYRKFNNILKSKEQATYLLITPIVLKQLKNCYNNMVYCLYSFN